MTAFAFSAKAQETATDKDVRVTGPYVHENLAVYLIHGKSAPGDVPLTLEEAIKLKKVRVLETGDVNELKIENTGDQPIFIQSGDIVKGGRQDRVITSSFILKPKSGEVPLTAFCVEHGRWSKRGEESAAQFASAAESMPSRKAKLSMRAAELEAVAARDQPRAATKSAQTRQAEVWDEISKVQDKLAAGLKARVAAPQSESSLQLSLENETLKKRRAAFIAALQKPGEETGDIVGYAFAVNGHLNSADVYVSNGLFRKMWPKQLQSAVTEAIGEKSDTAAQSDAPPPADAVVSFLAAARTAAAKEEAERYGNKFEIRDSAKAMYSAASSPEGRIVHENYLAK